MQNKTSLGDILKTYLLYVLPQHALTRVVYWLTRRQSRLTPAAIRWFTKRFDVDMSIAVQPDLSAYKTFNAFFTRPIKPEARPIAPGKGELASPADGRISAIGSIEEARIFQAKGRDYSLDELLGGDDDATHRLRNGRFATIYLSPRDYHRLHMPLAGRLVKQTYVPGRLHSVGPHTVRALPNLFARNERVIAQFDTDQGLMALVLVGAMNVAAIETVWHGLVTPPQQSTINHIDYRTDVQDTQSINSAVTLSKGEELGRFNMGSTIIVLLEHAAVWRVDMQPGDSVRMGQFLAQVS